MRRQWGYNKRCERCQHVFDHGVEVRNMTYSMFKEAMMDAPKQAYRYCDNCQRMTLQTLLTFDCDKEPADQKKPKPLIALFVRWVNWIKIRIKKAI